MKGHVSKRFTKTNICTVCNSNSSKKRHAENRDKENASRQLSHIKNKERESLNNKAYKEKNKDRTKKTRREYYLKNREDQIRRARQWSKAHAEHVRITSRKHKKKWRDNNLEKIKIKNSVWKSANLERVALYTRNRRARIKNIGGQHSIEDIIDILKLQKNRCAECGCKIAFNPTEGEKKIHVDHIMPVHLGGSNGRKNIQCLCGSCNVKKHATHPLDWAKKKGRLL